jgi:hypothetical protein
MNINNAVDKAYEGKSFKELLKAPASAIQGLSDGDAELLKKAFGIDSVKELAENKFFQIALAIHTAAKYEK